jgi:hypothetical protein
MKNAIILSLFALLATAAFAAPDSLACRTVDWLDAPGTTMLYGSTGTGEYEYSGTYFWDMAMGDSFLVWLPGGTILYLIDPYSQTGVDTLFTRSSFSYAFRGTAVSDAFIFITSGAYIASMLYQGDSLQFISEIIVPWASFHYAVIRDTFLYTASTGSYGLHCINIANPESIFVAWTAPTFFGFCGLEVVDTIVYSADAGTHELEPYSDIYIPYWTWDRVRIIGDTMGVGVLPFVNMDSVFFGDLASDGANLFLSQTEMSAGSEWMPYEIGASHLKVWETDYSYTWADPYGEPSFGVDILNDKILAVGFEHGFSIINYTQLGGMFEVAYYRDIDSIFAFTHFALKENRMFAMAHPRAGICRMYMFEIDERIISGIGETAPVKPSAIEISAHPNPFNSAVTIALDGVGDGSPVPFDVEIFDVNGRKIDVIARRAEPNEAISPNNRSSVPLDTRRDAVSINNCEFVWQPAPSLGSGVYLVRARVGGRGDLAPMGQTAVKRVVYLK